MGSSFQGVDVFEDAVQRFQEVPRAVQLLENARIDPTSAGTVPTGLMNLRVIVRGRMRATTEDALWRKCEQVSSLATFPVTTGRLEDGHGRGWDDMGLVSVTFGETIDRGREVSVAFVATFLQLEK